MLAPSYLRISTTSPDDNSSWREASTALTLQRLTSHINTSTRLRLNQLKAVFLPEAYRHSHSSTHVTNLTNLVTLCETHSIEIVWHGGTSDSQHRISPSFRQYVRRVREEREAREV
jgi:hypothetical protein